MPETFPDGTILEFHQRLKDLEKRLLENQEREDREFNTLWAELESLRNELFTHMQGGISQAQWQALLVERIPHFSQIREALQKIMSINPEIEAQLSDNFPQYLISNNLLAGLVDLGRIPFERINWLESLILPISNRLDSQFEDTEILELYFNRLLGILGYQTIRPNNGDVYRPDYHEAVEQRLSSLSRGTVLATRSQGYLHQGAVIRKAKVVISAGQ